MINFSSFKMNMHSAAAVLPEVEGLLFVVDKNLMDNRSFFDKFSSKLELPCLSILRSYKRFLFEILSTRTTRYSLDTYYPSNFPCRPYLLLLEPSTERVSFRIRSLQNQCLKVVLNNLDSLRNRAAHLNFLQKPTYNRELFQISTLGPWHRKFDKPCQTAWEIINSNNDATIHLQVDYSEENFEIIKQPGDCKMIYFLHCIPPPTVFL